MVRTIFVSALLAALLCTSVAADRITNDPNVPGANASAAGEEAAADESEQTPQAQSDPRLAQLVTYEAANKRLHRVVSEISAATGVGIRCGRSSKDWQVRDIPMTLYVKDLPLDVLLRAIADATHMVMTTGKLDGVQVYRITHNTRLEKQVQDYQRARAEEARLQALRQWDETARAKDVPQSVLAGLPDRDRQRIPFLLKKSELLALLGPSVRDKVVGGERYSLRLKDAAGAVRSALDGLLRTAWADIAKRRPDLESPSVEDLEESFVTIGCDPGSHFTFMACVMQPDGGQPDVTGMDVPAKLQEAVRARGVPPVASAGYAPETIKAGEPNSVYRTLYNTKLLNFEDNAPIPLPQDKRDVTYAQALIAIAKSKGLSLVCEDFTTYGKQGAGAQCFGTGAAVGPFLQSHSNRWLIDERNKLMVGPAASWIGCHESLVPESLFLNLMAEISGDGVGLDDYLPLFSLTRGQFDTWIRSSREIGWPEQAWSPLGASAPAWQIYASLGAEDRALASSEAGLPLAKIDPGITLPALASWAKAEDDDRAYREMMPVVTFWEGGPDPESGSHITWRTRLPSERTERLGDLTDLAVSSTITMRLVVNEGVQTPSPEMIELAGLPKESGWNMQVPKRSYRLQIAFERNGQRRVIEAFGPQNLPIYSPKRQAEVLTEIAGKNK